MSVRVALVVLLGILVLLAVGTAWNFSLAPNANTRTETATIIIDEGQGVKSIAKELAEKKLIRSAWLFRQFVAMRGSNADLKAGAYALSPSFSLLDTIRILEKGSPDDLPILLVEGWTSRQMGVKLAEKGIVELSGFLAAAETKDSRTLIPDTTYAFLSDKPLHQGLEGYLFPDTYRFLPNSSPASVIGKMLDTFGKRVSPELIPKIRARGQTIHEALTLASIVELEVRTPKDRRLVADIFLRRLAIGKPLESDATVNYVTGKGLASPSLADTEVESAYNTYRNQGLPPGPIGNPSLESIQAVAEPDANDSLYFLTDKEGNTHFAKTFEEHLSNKEKYLR